MTDTTTTELKDRIEQQRSAIGQDLDALGDRLSPRRMAERRKAAVRHGMTSMRERIMGSAGDARETTGALVSEATDKMREAPEMARHRIEGNPLGAGLLAFATGLVVATLLPETEHEQAAAERIQPAVEQVAGEVGKAAQESAEHLRPAITESAEHLKGRAQDAAAHVRDDARDASTISGPAASPSAHRP